MLLVGGTEVLARVWAVPTHPLWRPLQQPSAEEIAQARVQPHRPETVRVVAPDPAWPALFEEVRATVVGALGDRVLSLTHVGSTSVPGLWAKPVIDAALVVADSSREDDWLPDLEVAGFELRVREPEWEEHRCLRGTRPRANLHVWSPGSVEVQRHVAFRDWLAEHPDDREEYAAIKRELSAEGFDDAMEYNNRKSGMVYDLYEKIFAADSAYEHTPRPR